jgi:hypothetical protein
LDAFDIDPFAEILSGGSPYSEYAANYPGLVGSAVYHADANCDGDADAFDIGPFIARMTATPPDCGPCALRAGGCGIVATTIVRTAWLTLLTGTNMAPVRVDQEADRIIDLLATYAAPRHHEYLLSAAAFLAAHYEQANDPEQTELWYDVFDGLAVRFQC